MSALAHAQTESIAASLTDIGVLEAEGPEAHLLAEPLAAVIMALLQVSEEKTLFNCSNSC